MSNATGGSRLLEFANSDAGIFVVYVFWLLSQLPFLSSALRVDEPYYVWVADQVSRFPSDPYGGEINWYGSPQRIFETLPNPPLVPFCLAIWKTLFSSRETSLHLFAFFFSCIAIHGFGQIASHFRLNRVLPVIVLLCSPGFYLGSQVAMLDVPMLALLLLSLSASLNYAKTGQRSTLVVAMASAFLCPLAKYGGVLIVPLLAFLAIVSKKRVPLLLTAAAPLVSILFWNIFCRYQYGEFHWSAVRQFQMLFGRELPLVTAIGFLARFGLGVFPLVLVGPLLLSQSFKFARLAAVLVFIGTLWIGSQVGLHNISNLLLAASVVISVHVILAVIAFGYACLKIVDRDWGFLVLWVILSMLLQAAMPYTAVRYLLPVAPPVILLFLLYAGWIRSTVPNLVAAATNFLLVSSLAIGDVAIGDRYRSVIENEITPRLTSKTGRFYFSGHWGLQYYAQLAGGQVIDKRDEPQYKEDDLIVIPSTGIPDIDSPKLRPGLEATVQVVTETPRWPIRTVDAESSANFYGSWTHGASIPTLLPFGISTGPSDTFRLYRVSKVNH